jgi:hypothetical protein
MQLGWQSLDKVRMVVARRSATGGTLFCAEPAALSMYLSFTRETSPVSAASDRLTEHNATKPQSISNCENCAAWVHDACGDGLHPAGPVLRTGISNKQLIYHIHLLLISMLTIV